MRVLNEYWVVEMIVQDLLLHFKTLISAREELKRVFFTRKDVLREEHVKRAMSYVVIAECVSNLWLKDVELGKNYIPGLVQVFLDIFKDFQGRI